MNHLALITIDRLLAVAVLLLACYALTGAADDTSPAIITVRTDGSVSTVEMQAGNGIYPIANSVEYETPLDGIGQVVIVRVRIVPEFETQVYLPWMSR
jgi:hypothetical protein